MVPHPFSRTTDALAMVRLIRARKIVEDGGVVPEMRQAAAELESGRASPAGRQGRAIGVLRQGILKLRPDARLQELVRVRKVLTDAMTVQKDLGVRMEMKSGGDAGDSPDVLKARQDAVLRSLEPLEGIVQQIDTTLLAARKAGQEASAALASGARDVARGAQVRLEVELGGALTKVEESITTMTAPDETRKRMLQSAERLRILTGLRDRFNRIRDAATEADIAGANLEGPAAASRQLAKDTAAFAAALPPASKFAALRRPLKKASQHTDKSVEKLQAGRLEGAMTDWQNAEQALQEAAEVGRKELASLEKLWLLRQAAADIARLRPVIEDLESEQAALHDTVAAARKERRTVLDQVESQALLVRALDQVQESASLIREAELLKTPLDAARAAMKLAVGQLGEDQPEPAMASQKKSTASLREAAKAAASLVRQIETVVMEMDAVAEMSSTAASLLARQIELREATTDAPEDDFRRLAGEQDILLAEATVLAGLSVAPKAAAAFATACNEMKGAIGELTATRRAPAIERQKKAEEALRAGIVALDDYIRSLLTVLIPGSPGLVTDPLEEAKNVMMKILFLAAEQKELRELTQRTPEAALPNQVPKQMELLERLRELLSLKVFGPLGFVGKEHLEAAVRPMEQAAASLKASARNNAIPQQQLAEKELRIAFAMNLNRIIELLQQKLPPVNPNPNPPVPTPLKDGFSIGPMGDSWKNFGDLTAKGKTPGGKSSEWNSLTARERAALNENFARELPLEFRQVLKEYYEALSR